MNLQPVTLLCLQWVGVGCLDIYTLVYHFSFFFSLSLGDGPIETDSKGQSSRKSVRVYRTESYKMIKIYLKIQDIFTRPNELLPDVRRSDRFS